MTCQRMSLSHLARTCLEVGHERLLVELSGGEAERVDDVVNLLLAILKVLCGLFGRADWAKSVVCYWSGLLRCCSSRIGSGVDLAILDGDHGAIGLVDHIINLLELRGGHNVLVSSATLTPSQRGDLYSSLARCRISGMTMWWRKYSLQI